MNHAHHPGRARKETGSLSALAQLFIGNDIGWFRLVIDVIAGTVRTHVRAANAEEKPPGWQTD